MPGLGRSNPCPAARLVVRAPAGTKAVGTGTGGERVQPDHPVADRGRDEVPPGGERLEAGRRPPRTSPGDVVQPAAVGVDRYGAVAPPGPYPRRRSPAAVPARARVRSVVVPRMRARDVRADRVGLVEAGDVDQSASRKRESPHLGTGLEKRAGLAS